MTKSGLFLKIDLYNMRFELKKLEHFTTSMYLQNDHLFTNKFPKCSLNFRDRK
jgi:hypothetical protein